MTLIRAWEDWDDKHGSENDHPKEFPEKQVSCFNLVDDGLMFISNLNFTMLLTVVYFFKHILMGFEATSLFCETKTCYLCLTDADIM